MAITTGVIPLILAALALEGAVRWWPYPTSLNRPPTASTLVVDRQAHPLAAFASIQGEWQVPQTLDECGRWLPRAVEAVEDHRFRHHAGVDWYGLGAAIWQTAWAGRRVCGASTLTMQVQRLREPRPRTLASKVIELIRARQLERQLSKDALLVEWLNRAPFGGNLIGAGAASWRWFGVPCRDLTLGQAAFLAGLPQNPERLRPDLHPAAALARRNHVLARMLATGVITADEYDTARTEVWTVDLHPLPQRQDDRTASWTAVCAAAAAGRTGVIATAYDRRVLELADQALVRAQGKLIGEGIDGAALVVVDNASGEVRAAVGAGGPEDLDLTRCPRSTGSTLKPFLYAGAFAAGIATPASVVDDRPAAWGGFTPRDYDRTWRGQLTASEALADSRNLPAMHLMAALGVGPTGSLLEGLGLAGMAVQAQRAGLTLAVGGGILSPRDLARGYAAFVRCALADTATIPGLTPRACRQTLASLAGRERTAVVSSAAAPLGIAWKTGTSSGHRDAWCAAVTPTWTVVAWFGTIRGAGRSSLVGHDAAAPVALDLLAAIDPQPLVAWSEVGTQAPVGPVPVPVLPAALAITQPAPQARIRLETAAQPIRLPFTCQGATTPVWWFLNGTLLGSAQPRETWWWTCTPGQHHLRVVDGNGRGATVAFVVLADG